MSRSGSAKTPQLMLAEEMAEYIRRNFKQKGHPVLLADVGSNRWPGFENRIYKEIVPELSLPVFLADHLSGDFIVKNHPTLTKKIGVIPKEAQPDWDNWIDYVPRHASPRIRNRSYERLFWTAFNVPLEEGRKRIIRASRPFAFHDVDEGDDVPEGSLEIGIEFLPNLERYSQYSSNEVLASIERWINRQGLTAEQFEPAKEPEHEDERIGRSGTKPEEILARVLASLDETEIRRIEVPLDIVLKIIRKSK